MSSRGPLAVEGPGQFPPLSPLNPALLGTPSFQHLHLWLANHHLQKIWIRRRPTNHACWWRLASSGGSAQQRHGDYG